jgi:hypothetical protein
VRRAARERQTFSWGMSGTADERERPRKLTRASDDARLGDPRLRPASAA